MAIRAVALPATLYVAVLQVVMPRRNRCNTVNTQHPCGQTRVAVHLSLWGSIRSRSSTLT